MPLSRGQAWLVAVVATLAMSVSYVDRQVMAAIGASIRTALGIDAAHFGILASSFSLSYLVAAPLAGVAIDRLGARKGLVGAILVWSVVSASHALAPSFGALLALRVLLGTAEAPSFPAAALSVRRALPAGDRSAAFGLLFTGSSIGAAVGIPLAMSLDHAYGWRASFPITSTAGLLWVPLWLVVTRSKAVREVLQGPARAAVEPEGEGRGWLGLLGSSAVLRALVLVLGSAPGLMFLYVWMPQYLELGRGLPKASLPHYAWLPPLMADLGMVGFGLLASRRDRASSSPRSHVGLVLAAAALEATLGLAPLVAGTWPALLVLGLSAAGGGGLYTLLTSDMMSRVDPRRASASGGLTAAAQSLVYVALNPLVGRAIDRTRSFDGSMVLLGVVALPAAIAWALWPVGASVDEERDGRVHEPPGGVRALGHLRAQDVARRGRQRLGPPDGDAHLPRPGGTPAKSAAAFPATCTAPLRSTTKGGSHARTVSPWTRKPRAATAPVTAASGVRSAEKSSPGGSGAPGPAASVERGTVEARAGASPRA